MNDDAAARARREYQIRALRQRPLEGADLARARQSHAEQRALAALDRADAAEAALAASRAQVTEPATYRKGGPDSFFLDVARARVGMAAAKARLERHQAEMRVEMPRRQAARDRAAAAAYEAAFYSTPADRRALDAMLAAGGNPFERRAIGRTDGQGGYLAPPVYLVDQYVPCAREAAPFAEQWHQVDLPSGTSEVNVPRLALGTGTGPQSDTTAAGTRDLADSLVSAVVKVVAGVADVSQQWLDQGGGSAGWGLDELIFADLTADIATNTDGQCLLGAGGGTPQLLGTWPAGAIAAANGIVQADANNATSQTWTGASSGASLHVSAAQLVSLARRLRARSDGWAWFWHPWAWSLYTAQVDLQGRPLVNSQDLGSLPDGALGEYQNIPVFGDSNIPVTFGGTIAPYMGPISNGQYAAVAGSGGTPNYTPLLLARPDDLHLFAGDIRIQQLDEVLAGAGGIRFQATRYLAAMPHRYVAAAAAGSSVSAGGDVAHGTLTWQVSNSLLQLASSGY